MNNLDLHSKNIGSIIVNFQALEFALRLFLYEIFNESNGNTITLSQLTKSTVGESFPLNSLTNYDTLFELIKKANKELSRHHINIRIDETIVDIRDAIAHGRVLSLKEDGPVSIIKFSKPIGNLTKVTFCSKLENDWFKEQNIRINIELQKIIKISRLLGLKCFPY
ncbi:MAG: hypothetical protein ACYDH2_04155 [Anaerolineaceae bacterium]